MSAALKDKQPANFWLIKRTQRCVLGVTLKAVNMIRHETSPSGTRNRFCPEENTQASIKIFTTMKHFLLPIGLTCIFIGCAVTPRSDSTPGLTVSIRPNSHTAALNIQSPSLPADQIEFRTLEALVVGNQIGNQMSNRPFGLFQVYLAPTARPGQPGWTNKDGILSYRWAYPQGAVVLFSAKPGKDFVDLTWTVENHSAYAWDLVQLHPCIMTAEAPQFFPGPRPPHTPVTEPNPKRGDFSEMYDRLFLWYRGGPFAFSSSEWGYSQPHLAFMRQGEPPIHWAWWTNSQQKTFDVPFIALASHDSHHTLALALNRSIWATCNTGDERACFHLFPDFGRLLPGQSSTVHGRFYVLDGMTHDAYKRYLLDFQDPNNQL
jgi:hypothetical protein